MNQILDNNRFKREDVELLESDETFKLELEALQRRALERIAKQKAEALAAEQKAQAEAEAAQKLADEQKAQAEAEAAQKLADEQKAQAEAEAAQKLAAEQKAQAEAEAAQKLADEQKAQAEAEAAQKLADEQKAQAEAEAAQKLADEQKAQAEAEAAQKLADEQKAQAEAEAAQKLADEQKAQAEAEAAQKLAAEQKAQAEAEAAQKLADEQKAQAEAEAAQKLAAEQKAQAEAEAAQKLAAEQKAQAEAEAAQKLADEQKAQAEAEAAQKLADEQKAQAEAEAAQKLEAEQKAQAEAEAAQKLEAEQKAQAEAEAAQKLADEQKAQAEAEAAQKLADEQKAQAEATQKLATQQSWISDVAQKVGELEGIQLHDVQYQLKSRDAGSWDMPSEEKAVFAQAYDKAIERLASPKFEAVKQTIQTPALAEAPKLEVGTAAWVDAVLKAAEEQVQPLKDAIGKLELDDCKQCDTQIEQARLEAQDAVKAWKGAPNPDPAEQKSFAFQSLTSSSDVYKLDASVSGTIDLGAGYDGIVLSGKKSDYVLRADGPEWHVSPKAGGSPVDIHLKGVELLKFEDGMAFLDPTPELYQASRFNRAIAGAKADSSDILYTAESLERYKPSTALKDLLARHGALDEDSAYDGETFVKQSFPNIFGREADAGGLEFWTSQTRHMSKAEILYNLCETEEAKAFDASLVGLNLSESHGELTA